MGDPGTLVTLAALTALQILLGIDNIVLVSILVARLPREQRELARKLGLATSTGLRILLLLTASWIAGLTEPLFTIADHGFSGRDLLLIFGGVLLVGKALKEIADKIQGEPEESLGHAGITFRGVILQILLMDLVFSFDSVITAVGFTDKVWIMVASILIAVAVMLVASRPLAIFINANPSVKMLALCVLLLIGVALVAEGFQREIPKGYLVAGVAFAILVESLSLWSRRGRPADLPG